MQPYAPTLFAQGDLPGPELLLKFQRGELNEAELKAAWDAKRPRNNAPKTTWPENMPLYCRGCSEGGITEVHRKLSHFTYTSNETAWEEVVSKGMERLCRRCSIHRETFSGN